VVQRIVLFDGVCNFCSEAVNFIIRRDHKKQFKFAPLQSKIGHALRAKHGIEPGVDSIVLIEDGQAFTHSTAAIRIAKRLGGVLSVSAILSVIPAGIRDAVYNKFAQNRYRFFGKKEVCMIPTQDLRDRFLD
jgi:predicted DCC family thiol-disulfide oxidoreductase YuxK